MQKERTQNNAYGLFSLLPFIGACGRESAPRIIFPTGAAGFLFIMGEGVLLLAKALRCNIKPPIRFFYKIVFCGFLRLSESIQTFTNQRETKTMRLLLLSLITILSLTACREGEAQDVTSQIEEKQYVIKTANDCDEIGWKDPKARLDCLYPNPPIGRWHAVYTEEFAKEYNLPKKNISNDFSEGVDYMEMEVLPYGNGGIACMANMLVKKPHDIALYDSNMIRTPMLSSDRKLLRVINIDNEKNNLKPFITLDSASRDYSENTGFSDSTFSMFIENVISGYDYISADMDCRNMSMHLEHYPDQYAFWVNKASIWGKFVNKYQSSKVAGRPKEEDFFNSHFFINVPKELPQEIFKDIIKGKKHE